jgi:hypothetical protein
VTNASTPHETNRGTPISARAITSTTATMKPKTVVTIQYLAFEAASMPERLGVIRTVPYPPYAVLPLAHAYLVDVSNGRS